MSLNLLSPFLWLIITNYANNFSTSPSSVKSKETLIGGDDETTNAVENKAEDLNAAANAIPAKSKKVRIIPFLYAFIHGVMFCPVLLRVYRVRVDLRFNVASCVVRLNS